MAMIPFIRGHAHMDIFNLHPKDMTMLNQIIQQAFRCQNTDPNYERMREFRVFFTSRKTLLNEFNHFEGNMNIFQPAIDITKSDLRKEMTEIEAKLIEIRNLKNSLQRESQAETDEL